MYIFMEYCDEGTLEEVSRLGLQEHVIRLYSKQITTAINVLHEHGIVHRDIKGTESSIPSEIKSFRFLSYANFVAVVLFFPIRSKHFLDVIGADQAGRLWLFGQAEEQHSHDARGGEQHLGNGR